MPRRMSPIGLSPSEHDRRNIAAARLEQERDPAQSSSMPLSPAGRRLEDRQEHRRVSTSPDSLDALREKHAQQLGAVQEQLGFVEFAFLAKESA